MQNARVNIGQGCCVSSARGLRVGQGVLDGSRGFAELVCTGILIALGHPALAACKLGKLAEFPVTMVNMHALTTAKINDRDVQFTVDSGAFFSMLSAATASELGLKTHLAPFGLYVTGVNGSTSVMVATVKVLNLAGVPLHNVDFLVGGSDISGSIGLLGQNVLHVGDVEYDLGQGVIRLMRAEDCRKALLAYWVKATQPYSEMDIDPTERFHTIGHAYLNGAEIRVEFDSGAGTSILSLQAAARAGIKPDSPGVVPAGMSGGVGRGTFATYIAPFASFKIGQEEIKNTRLRIGGIELSNADMLIGADFFLSHRIYVANSQHKLYFTYNGGPVFNLSGAKYPQAAPDRSPGPGQAPADETAAAGAAAAGSAAPPPAAQEQAADLSRRGQALAARRDFEQALADLDRACQLVPDNADYVYQRGMIHWQMNQVALARADFDQALKLKPDSAPALLSRAELRLRSGDVSGALADLDATDPLLAKEEDRRLSMALLYERGDRLDSAAKQFDLWIASHRDDLRLPEALNGRCWVKALENIDLDGALEDCNGALRRAKSGSPFYAEAADSRGLVFLRMGRYDKSIADYDASIKINPENAWSLYGRGTDEAHLGKTAEGRADRDEALKIWPNIADQFKRYGIAPEP